MIYLYEIPSVDPRTGYGGLFHALSCELMRSHSQRVALYRPKSLPQPFAPEVEIFFGQPYTHVEQHFANRLAPLRGVYTMFEQEQIPWEFVYCVEKHFDFVIVPTEWCAGVFRRIFPTKPIYVSPVGIDTNLYPFSERPANRTPFTYLWQGFHLKDRKRFDLVVEAFDRLGLPDTRLLVKVLDKATQTGATFYLTDKKTRITWISDSCSQGEKLSLWQQCDFAICPSNGEGIGMMPLEWMATGLPCAFTNNTGAATYANELYNYPLPATEHGVYGDGVPYSHPSVESIYAVMRYAYENREELRFRAATASNWIRREHSIALAASNFIATIDRVRMELRGQHAA